MPSLISILSSQSSSRFAHAFSKETRVSAGAENASVKVPGNLALLFGPAASPFQQQQYFFPPQMTVVQHPPIPRGIDSQCSSAKPADRCGLHLIRGDGFDLRLQRPSTAAVSSALAADVVADVSDPSSLRLADLISEYFEDGDDDSDAPDGLKPHRFRTDGMWSGHDGTHAQQSMRVQYPQDQFHGAASALFPAQPARSNLGSHGEDVNQRLSGDYLDRQMQSTEHDQLHMVQSLAAVDGPAESALFADVIAAMTDARVSHVDASRSSKSSCDDVESASQSLSGSRLNAAVAGRLRAMGYDAAVCTTQWESSPAVPEGSYEYIDVFATSGPLFTSRALSPAFTRTASPTTTITSATQASLPTCTPSASAEGASPSPASAIRQRFIIDLDFRAQFQIARPTREYASALESTPLIFVGREERLAHLVEVVSGAMHGALRAQGMHIPPWRKWEYLNAKWMAGNRRRVLCEVKGDEGKGVGGKGMGRREVVGARDKTAVADGCNGGNDFQAGIFPMIISATVTAAPADLAVPAPTAAAAAASPLAVVAAPPAAAPAASSPGTVHPSAALDFPAADMASQVSRQQHHPFPNGVDALALVFQGRPIPARSFASLQQ
ncbi:hypothetical protein CLOP_g21340 [Closterium sp. NIES-67]|nr:hypothetical protein CLOP_g21340 [Closterium sp. NIES-67]